MSPRSLSPVPGRGASAGTLWLWGAGPLLLILLTCLGILGRDGHTVGPGGRLGTSTPYLMSPGVPKCHNSGVPRVSRGGGGGVPKRCVTLSLQRGVPGVLVTPWGGVSPVSRGSRDVTFPVSPAW